jgi:transcription antitermination factor NusB
MKRREQARQIALQALYQLDLRGEDFGPDAVEFLRSSTGDPEVYFFACRLTEGTWAWRAEADRLIAEAAEHWRIDRMAPLDRNILRLATWEICRCPDIPPRVAIDQAIELAKRFSSAESGAFVNGVLDRVLRNVKGDEAARAETGKGPAAGPAPPPDDARNNSNA